MAVRPTAYLALALPWFGRSLQLRRRELADGRRQAVCRERRLPVARSNGVLAALAVPEGAVGGGFSGTSALLKMDGWTWEDIAVQREVAVHLELPSMRLGGELLRGPMEPFADELRCITAARLKLIDEPFESASAYGRARSADPAHPTDLRWEALQPVLRGERPLFVQANELPQIRHALALAERHGFKLVIVGGADAWCRFPFNVSLLIFHVVTDPVTPPHVSPRSRRERVLT